MKTKFLPLFWWLKPTMPQAYVCPLLMTITVICLRLKGKNVGWSPGNTDAAGAYLTPARVVRVSAHGVRIEERCIFPRSWIMRECAFWNSHIGIRWRARHRED